MAANVPFLLNKILKLHQMWSFLNVLYFVEKSLIKFYVDFFFAFYFGVCLINTQNTHPVTIWVRHSGGPPFRRSAIPGYYCYNNPNSNPILTLTLT